MARVIARVGTALRALAVLAGVLALGGAFLAVRSPVVEQAVPIEPLLAVVGYDYVLVALVGLAAAGVAVGVLLQRAVTGIEENSLPDVERGGGTIPGSDLDFALGEASSIRATERHHEIRRRVRNAAIDALVATGGYSREAARGRVDDGTWTDDPLAGDFLAGESLDPPSLGHRLLSGGRDDDWFRRRVRHAVCEIEAIERGSES